MFDLLIKNGRVIDPARNIDDKLDVAINGSEIARVARDIPASEGKELFDASGKIVTPGLIDMHAHVYESFNRLSVGPDAAGLSQGVTTVVDAGTSGQATFGGLVRYIIPACRTSVFCFLNLASTGLSVTPELRDWKDVDIKAIEAAIEANPRAVKGIKIRMVGPFAGREATEIVKTAKTTAKKFGLPVVIHIGDTRKEVPPSSTKQFLPLLERGDILSHFFSAQQGAAFPEGVMMPELKDAMERGVIMDIAHGKHHLSFEMARRGMSRGVFPTTLSTDLTINSTNDVVFGLTVMMSEFLALGMDLKKVVEMSTINAARALGEGDRIGSLGPGMQADVSILEVLSGQWTFLDSGRNGLEGNRYILPIAAVKLGKLIPAQPIDPAPVESLRRKSGR
jgi:dihydroorotase